MGSLLRFPSPTKSPIYPLPYYESLLLSATAATNDAAPAAPAATSRARAPPFPIQAHTDDGAAAPYARAVAVTGPIGTRCRPKSSAPLPPPPIIVTQPGEAGVDRASGPVKDVVG